MFSHEQNTRFKEALDAYMKAFTGDANKYATRQSTLILPIVSGKVLLELFKCAETIFKGESVLLEVRSPCIVVGDIHGQILDLYRIIQTFGMPNRQKYIFLGDLVDRGEFSVEALIIVCLMKVLWPDNVYLIRGNHEFQFLCSQCGFMTQMLDFLEDYSIYQAAVEAFEYIPLAARIDRVMLCVHGGIGPKMHSVNDIRSLKRPIEDFGDETLDSLVWSDPSDTVETFEDSTRGTGYIFGRKACEAFMTANGLTLIIRGHECVENGCKTHFDNKLVTVFSASNYCGLVDNRAGVLEVESSSKWKIRQFSPLPWLLRENVMFRRENQDANDSTGLKNRLKGSASVKRGVGELCGSSEPKRAGMQSILSKVTSSSFKQLPTLPMEMSDIEQKRIRVKATNIPVSTRRRSVY